MKPLYVAAFKSFGDFVIALSSVKRVDGKNAGHCPTLLAGNHLRDLATAIRALPMVRFIGDDTWTDVPAAFDLRKRGGIAALKSLLDLRRGVASIEDRRPMVFDRVGLREWLIGSGRRRLQLSDRCGNIYLAYEQALTDYGYPLAVYPPIPAKAVRRAVIVPGSRIARKVVPAAVIQSVYCKLTERGIDTSVLLMEGEAVEMPARVASFGLPRAFDVLIKCLGKADMIISADSLSAHLAEHQAIPNFVLTPSPNSYWLPLSAYVGAHWASFDDLSPLQAWLDLHPIAEKRQ